jgi:protein TonB
VKTLLSVGFAITVNLALFVMMERMVSARAVGWESPLETLSLAVVKAPERSRPFEPKQVEREEQEVLREPQLRPPQLQFSPIDTGEAPKLARTPLPAMNLHLGPRPSLSDLGIEPAPLKPLQPTVRIDPQYPRRALSKGIEGYVIVGFTIEVDGSTTAVRVLDSKPPVIFDRSAVEAVERWRFDPQPELREDSTRFEFGLAGS